ncbi:hypothetical protein SAM23877_3473 [Streptomyces ambofaciens ATCC 23877]|uniref:Uncharacterized protein n=1 Tax=Streptomyces ambofaciens (strain ATCC 23877 / 3486 / DSM 40053 / JCM 4204 / NBRC 12836 / NRRL B-2516) TaxID=278992 RepID=A0A0K2ATT6_STRA7|nr:hypothetical protein SAM23877_3473 [Streptomyces ambofaciens ATCC 23877]
MRPGGGRGEPGRRATGVPPPYGRGPLPRQPHWQGLPDWQPQPQPEPQPHAAIRGRLRISAGCSVGRSRAGSDWVLGESATGSS